MTRGNVNSDTGRIADSSITTAAIPFSEGMVSGFETASHPEVTEYKPKGRFSSFWGQDDSAMLQQADRQTKWRTCGRNLFSGGTLVFRSNIVWGHF